MRAMILAAGRGERMGELTKHTPKPLLRVAGRFLIEHTIQNLKQANIQEIVINVSYLGEQIMTAIGDGTRYGVRITYSEEPQRLETGGGIVQALPLLGKEPFIVLSSDIVTDYPLANLAAPSFALAHLVLVDNPPYHAQGDFALSATDRIDFTGQPKLTFGNIGIYSPALFASYQPGFFPWRDVVFPAIHAQKVTGEHYAGLWFNVGTPEDLAAVNAAL